MKGDVGRQGRYIYSHAEWMAGAIQSPNGRVLAAV